MNAFSAGKHVRQDRIQIHKCVNFVNKPIFGGNLLEFAVGFAFIYRSIFSVSRG